MGPGPCGALIIEFQGLWVPEHLRVVPAALLQPFHVLPRARVAQAPANAMGPLTPVTGPLE